MGDQAPVSGAVVELTSAEEEAPVAVASTGEAGRFEFIDVAPGRYVLVVRHVGFEGARRVVDLAGGMQHVVVRLAPVRIDLDPVMVSASRRQEKVLDAPASVSVLGARELAPDVVPAAVATLRHTPGVELVQVGLDRYQLSLRGFNTPFAARTLALVDYRPAVFPGLLLNAFASMPVATVDLDRVEVVRGPGAALYGGGVEQGVVHFVTKNAFAHPGTTVQAGGGGRGFVQGAFRHAGLVGGRLGYKLVGSYSRGHDWEFDPDDPADRSLFEARHAAFEEFDHDVWKGYVLGELAYRLRPSVSLTAQGGFSSFKQIVYSNAGESQVDAFPNAFGQLRLQAGDAFALLALSASPGSNGFHSYRTNRLSIDRSKDLNAQVQYRFDLLRERAEVVVGSDLRAYLLDTEGTLHGRNESGNDYVEAGAYLHALARLSASVDLLLAGRADYNGVLETVAFSPRAALVVKPAPGHRARLTYNRAYAMPGHGAFFLDNVVADRGPYRLRLSGNRAGWSYGDGVRTSSVLPGVGRYDGVGVPLEVAYAAALDELAQSGALAGYPETLPDFLEARTAQIAGFSEGQMVLNGAEVMRLPRLDPVRETVSNTVEVGYRGLLAERLLLSVDAYYTRKRHFVSRGIRITPDVMVPGLAGDLRDAVARAFSDDELAAYGLDAAELAEILAAAGGGLAEHPVGLVEPEENYDAGTPPEAVLTFINFGAVDFFGLEAAAELALGAPVRLFASYSWMSDTFFDERDLGEAGTGLVASMNAPQHKASGGVEYGGGGPLSLRLAGRYVGDFVVSSGVRQGVVERYLLLDAGAGFDFAKVSPGLRLDVTVQNLLDHRHREYVAVPKLGRMTLARLTYTL